MATSNSENNHFSTLQSPSKVRLILSLLLLMSTLAIYNGVSRAPFLNYDDDYYILQNSHVRSGLNWATISWAFQSLELSNWHPITWISHALDVQLFGLNPAGHHYVNVLLHGLNVILLFVLLDRLTGKVWRSCVVAALFALHPINVESVAWISERKNVLSMTFFLVGLIAYAWYAQRPGVRRYLAVFLCYAFGLMAKPQVITFPFVLLLLDYWPLDRIAAYRGAVTDNPIPPRSTSQIVLEKVPLLLLSLGSAVVTMEAQTTAIHGEFSLWQRLANACLAYVSYLKQLMWPKNLAPMYPHPDFSLNWLLALLSLFALVGITTLMIRTRRPYLVVGWLWFLGTLVPMIGVVQVGVQAMADRYAYIPFIGLFIALVWGIADILGSWHAPRFAAPLASALAIVALALVCHRQIGFWHDNLTLWSHTIDITQNNFVAEDNVAMALVIQGRIDDAMTHFRSAIRINPKDPIATLNVGLYEERQGNFSDAIVYYQRVLQLTQDRRLLSAAAAAMGSTYFKLKDFDLAQRGFDSALRLFPENSRALIGLGLLAQKSGALGRAEEDYTKSLQFQPTDVGYLLLANVLEVQGELERSRAARAEAERISSNFNEALQSARSLVSD